MAIIDKIQLSGTVYTIGNETTTAVTSASTDNEIPTAKAVYDAIPQGGGGESCTVDSTTMFYTFSGRYSNDGLDMRVRYAVLDYAQDKTERPNVSIEVNFRDINYNTYVSQNISLDYSTSSYTLGDISQAEYIDVTYDSTIEDFKIAVSTAHTSTVFVGYINFWEGNIKVPFYTISSGSPCTVIENGIPSAMSELGNSMLKGLREISIGSQQDSIFIYTETLGGNGNSRKIKLDEIDGSGSKLKPDIYVGLGTSGWTEIKISQECNIGSLKSTKYRVTYNNSELDTYSMGLQLIVEYAGNEVYDYVNFDETKHPSLQTQDVFSAATVDWNASTKELVITYPETIELYGIKQSVNIGQIYSNGCNFGKAITKLESYGEAKQALKPYVKETRAALSGKQDTLVSGTNIKTINGETLLGEGNIDIQGGGGSITIDPSLDSGSTNPVANSAITTAINEKQNKLTGAIGISINQYQNTISLDVPIFKAKDFRSCFVGDNPNYPNIVSGQYSFAVGLNNNVTGNYSLAVGGLDHYGEGNSATTTNTFAFGRGNIAKSFCSTVVGYHNSSSNKYETAFGQYNNSVSASTTFGDSGNTLFSVGNGTNNARHNAFEIRQNGDIYISKDGQDVKLQDQLGGGGGVDVVQTTGNSTTDVMSQDAITNALRKTNLVSASYSSGHLDLEYKDPFNTSYRTMLKFGMINGMTVANIGSERPSFSLVEASAITTSVTSESTDAQVPSAKAVNDKLGGLSLVKLTQSEYSAMEQAGTLDNSTLYIVINS